jgi:hypothetical protein
MSNGRAKDPTRTLKPGGLAAESYAETSSDPMRERPHTDILFAFEMVLAALERTTEALGVVLDTMERGDRLSDSAMAECRVQLVNVTRDRQQLEASILGARTPARRH